ncbi:unnamed protein product (macronuclear) [Paramecium tetraurelia]|uniref:Uncharacterized protein n=1 Tax=Paramecium tetraurelia TaxID=5888 RepID=A0BRI3_PARTE|nr:uncharacterized protein GSPATT00031381001 [Paramecium tetraurelia]CAK61150.1 unnamed protein product [Paramecium tetraurelia]|eukprot:XP_001428548.1 hypothetical protein (macronuclear) [Paramecium tetraurelia strain d4-2]
MEQLDEAKTCAQSYLLMQYNTQPNTCDANQGDQGCLHMDLDVQIKLHQFAFTLLKESEHHVQKCDIAATDATREDDTKCSTYQQSDFVARIGGCQTRATGDFLQIFTLIYG